VAIVEDFVVGCIEVKDSLCCLSVGGESVLVGSKK